MPRCKPPVRLIRARHITSRRNNILRCCPLPTFVEPSPQQSPYEDATYQQNHHRLLFVTEDVRRQQQATGHRPVPGVQSVKAAYFPDWARVGEINLDADFYCPSD